MHLCNYTQEFYDVLPRYVKSNGSKLKYYTCKIMRHFQIEHSACDCTVQTSLCMGLPMKTYTWRSSAISMIDTWKVAHFVRIWYSCLHITYLLKICHLSLYHISVNIFWQVLENFFKNISLCCDSSIPAFTWSDMRDCVTYNSVGFKFSI